jgi:hypothetical protein
MKDGDDDGDGYVKFRLDHVPGAAVEAESISAINGLRSRLFELGLIGMNENGIGYGNVSMRAGTDNVFWISGTATGGKPVLNSEDYSLVTSCDIDGNTVSCRGSAKASSESMSHYAIYESCTSVRYVVHVHSSQLFSFMARGGWPSTPPNANYGTPELAREIASLVAGSQEGMFVTLGHEDGVFAFGSDCRLVEKAILGALALSETVK